MREIPVVVQKMAISDEPTLFRSGWQKMGRWVAIASGLWLGLAGLLVALLFWGNLLNCPWLVAVYLGATVFGSGASFAAYGLDKRRATTDRWRISEATLQWLSFLGGWPGGLLAQRTFRHKTQKFKFQLLFWLIVCLHAPLVVLSLMSIRLGS